MKKLLSILYFSLLTLISTSFRPVKTSKHFTVKLIAPGIWAAINNDNYGHAICNAGIIDLGDKTLIFDPFMNLDAAADLKEIAFELTGKQASIIINSHFHNDHVRGNQLFENANIISSYWTKNQMAISEPEELASEKISAPKSLINAKKKLLNSSNQKDREENIMWVGYYEGIIANNSLIKTKLPNLTFTDSLWIYGTKKTIKLIEFKNGHTQSDVVLFIPKDEVVFMGDLLFENRHPYLGHGNPNSWIKHLDEMITQPQMNAFVPGHGAVSNKSTLKLQKQYITEIQEMVVSSKQKLIPDSIIKKTPIMPAYQNWKFDRFYGANVSFLIKQQAIK